MKKWKKIIKFFIKKNLKMEKGVFTYGIIHMHIILYIPFQRYSNQSRHDLRVV